jgi:hypothetical protein
VNIYYESFISLFFPYLLITLITLLIASLKKMGYCDYCSEWVSYSANYCPSCGTAIGTVALAGSSYKVVASAIKESANPLIDYVDKNGGKAEVSAQVGNRKISSSYTQKASEISYTSYTPNTAFGTVVKSSSSISIGKFANTIKKSAEAAVEYAKLGGNVKVITQVDDVEVTTSYTQESNRTVTLYSNIY